MRQLNTKRAGLKATIASVATAALIATPMPVAQAYGNWGYPGTWTPDAGSVPVGFWTSDLEASPISLEAVNKTNEYTQVKTSVTANADGTSDVNFVVDFNPQVTRGTARTYFGQFFFPAESQASLVGDLKFQRFSAPGQPAAIGGSWQGPLSGFQNGINRWYDSTGVKDIKFLKMTAAQGESDGESAMHSMIESRGGGAQISASLGLLSSAVRYEFTLRTAPGVNPHELKWAAVTASQHLAGSKDFAYAVTGAGDLDTDGDGHNNAAEMLAGTDPYDANDYPGKQPETGGGIIGDIFGPGGSQEGSTNGSGGTEGEGNSGQSSEGSGSSTEGGATSSAEGSGSTTEGGAGGASSLAEGSSGTTEGGTAGASGSSNVGACVSTAAAAAAPFLIFAPLAAIANSNEPGLAHMRAQIQETNNNIQRALGIYNPELNRQVSAALPWAGLVLSLIVGGALASQVAAACK